MQNTKQAVFSLGEGDYSLDIMDVVTIEKLVAIESVSSLPQNFKGVMNLRGDIIPIYSLRKKFGMEEIPPDQDTRFVIVSTDGVLVAFEVDKMTGIVEVSRDQLNEVPSIVRCSEASYLKAISKVGDQLVIMMDKDNILSEDDRQKMNKALKK